MSEQVPEAAIQFQAMTLPLPCFTAEVVCFGSCAVPSFLDTFTFPLLWKRFMLVSSQHKNFVLKLYWLTSELLGKFKSGRSIFVADGVCILLRYLCNSAVEAFCKQQLVILSPHALWRLLVMSMTVVSGFFFTALMIFLSSTAFVFVG